MPEDSSDARAKPSSVVKIGDEGVIPIKDAKSTVRTLPEGPSETGKGAVRGSAGHGSPTVSLDHTESISAVIAARQKRKPRHESSDPRLRYNR